MLLNQMVRRANCAFAISANRTEYLSSTVHNLPEPSRPSGRIDWRLDTRGLEWTELSGKDQWMPFACIRLATLGNVAGHGWRLRLTGPPGVALIHAGQAAGQFAGDSDLQVFSVLCAALIAGADEAGCRARFRLNHGRALSGWLWSRQGQLMETGAGLVAVLPALPRRANEPSGEL